MRRALAGVVLLLAPVVASAEWIVEVRWDEMTDAREAMVHSNNGDGHRLLFYRADNGTIRATLNPLDGLIRSLDCDTRPIYRIDRTPAVNTGAPGDPLASRCTGDAVGWRAFDAATWPLRGPMVGALSGARLALRFNRRNSFTGGESRPEDATFDLAGLERALRLAVELMGSPSK